MFCGFQNVYGQEKVQKPIIVIDPGHGGIDSGAIGIQGLQEKAFALRVAKEIVRLNELVYSNGLDIYLTRYSDTLISLKHRILLTKAIGPDVFISIHSNHSDEIAAKGLEIYVSDSGGSFMRPSISLAHQMYLKMKEEIGLKGRGIKFVSFEVLRETKNHCAGALLELGFLSNSNEEAYNEKQSGIAAYAISILETLFKIYSYD